MDTAPNMAQTSLRAPSLNDSSLWCIARLFLVVIQAQTDKSVLRNLPDTLFFCGKHHEPKRAFGMAEVFLDLPKIRLEMAGIGNEGGACQLLCAILARFSLAPAIWAVEQPDPWQSCRLLEPLPAQGAQRALGQKPARC